MNHFFRPACQYPKLAIIPKIIPKKIAVRPIETGCQNVFVGGVSEIAMPKPMSK